LLKTPLQSTSPLEEYQELFKNDEGKDEQQQQPTPLKMPELPEDAEPLYPDLFGLPAKRNANPSYINPFAGIVAIWLQLPYWKDQVSHIDWHELFHSTTN